MTVNQEGVLATGGDNGSLSFWESKSGHCFQQSRTIVQPGTHPFDFETPIIYLCMYLK
ncbi:putative transcription factor WD40-like family [Helianthus annuus]|nr:putative transcription factor WD40-like family [Helianthus annuus]